MDLNTDALGQYFTLNYTLTEDCLLKNIKKLAPASFMLIQKNKDPIFKTYWNLANYYHDKNNISVNDASQKLSEMLDASIKNQLISDVPIGAFLSGGIDSASIVAGASLQLKEKKIDTFSIGFEEDTYSELSDAKKRLSQLLKTNHFDEIVKNNLIKDIQETSKILDEPMADTSIIPYFHLSKFAAQRVKVALSGDGADELLCGYDTYVADKIRNFSSWIPKKVSLTLSDFVNKNFPTSFGKVSFDYKLKKFLRGHSMTQIRPTSFGDQYSTIVKRPIFCIMTLKKKIKTESSFSYFSDYLKDVKDCHYLDRAMYTDIKTWLANDILVKVDMMSMAHSLECRAPFLDHKLVEFCASLPPKLKLNYFNKKFLLKKSQMSRLPKRVLKRKKQGFGSPIAEWLKGQSGEYIHSLLTTKKIDEFFNSKFIESIWEDHVSKRQNNSYKIFGIACFSLWLNKLEDIKKVDG